LLYFNSSVGDILKRRKRKQIIISLVLATIISFTLFCIGYINYLHPKLGTFEIEGIKEENDGLYLNFLECHNAISYHIIGYNEEDTIIYEKDSETNRILLDDFYPKYNENIRFVIYAYNKNKDYVSAINEYTYNSLDLSFNTSNEHYISIL
jgi:hypothetical protein